MAETLILIGYIVVTFVGCCIVRYLELSGRIEPNPDISDDLMYVYGSVICWPLVLGFVALAVIPAIIMGTLFGAFKVVEHFILDPLIGKKID